MAKRKVTLLARLIDDADMLSNEELQTLSDTIWLKLQANKRMNKPESKPAERKPSQKRKEGKEVEPMNLKHPDEPCGNCGEGFSKNIHHMKSWPNYHEFFEVDPNRIIDDVEPAGEASKGVGV